MLPKLIADAGVPMLFWQMPIMALAIVPIIVVESFVVWRKLQMPVASVLLGTTLANIISTFVGIPMAWAMMVLLNIASGSLPFWNLNSPIGIFEAVVLQSSWLVPHSNSQLCWMVPTATLVLLIPYFFASVLSEGWVLRHLWRMEDKRLVRAANWQANLASYIGLALVTGAWLWMSIAGNAVIRQ